MRLALCDLDRKPAHFFASCIQAASDYWSCRGSHLSFIVISLGTHGSWCGERKKKKHPFNKMFILWISILLSSWAIWYLMNEESLIDSLKRCHDVLSRTVHAGRLASSVVSLPTYVMFPSSDHTLLALQSCRGRSWWPLSDPHSQGIPPAQPCLCRRSWSWGQTRGISILVPQKSYVECANF